MSQQPENCEKKKLYHYRCHICIVKIYISRHIVLGNKYLRFW